MIFEFISLIIVKFLSIFGYLALTVLMAFESMILPIPSELVMPFAGFLIVENQFTWFLVIIFSTLGTILGSLISYYIGYYGGYPFINKFGKYFLLDNKTLIWTESWFRSKGGKTIFISRFIPVVRHLISIPAGMGKMNIKKFILYTILGGAIWNSFLVYLGVMLRENWQIVHDYSKLIDIVIIILLVMFIIWFIYSHLKRN